MYIFEGENMKIKPNQAYHYWSTKGFQVFVNQNFGFSFAFVTQHNYIFSLLLPKF